MLITRNPDEYPDGTWCHTTDPEIRWDFCEVPECSGKLLQQPFHVYITLRLRSQHVQSPYNLIDYSECRLTDTGTEYLESLSITVSGGACQP